MLISRNLTDLRIDSDSLVARDQIDRPQPMSAKQISQQYWRELHDRGASIRQISTMVGVPYVTVFRGIRTAREDQARILDPPPVTPILDSAGYRPNQPCGHRGSIRTGSRFFCPECNDLGTRNHPGLKIAPDDPLLKQPKKRASKAAKRTRKERRKQLVVA
jgi:hypothetical protein